MCVAIKLFTKRTPRRYFQSESNSYPGTTEIDISFFVESSRYDGGSRFYVLYSTAEFSESREIRCWERISEHWNIFRPRADSVVKFEATVVKEIYKERSPFHRWSRPVWSMKRANSSLKRGFLRTIVMYLPPFPGFFYGQWKTIRLV